MKRVLSIILVSLTLTTVSFAKDFMERIFEVRGSVPLSLTNNTIMLADIFQKEIVVDLSKIANEMPAEGFTVLSTINPYAGVGMNILKFHGEINLGFETFFKIGVTKGIFDFIGNGNDLYETLDIGIIAESDVFAHADVNASIEIGDLQLSFTPSVFYPVLHTVARDSSAKISNDEDGNIGLDINGNADIYTGIDIKNPFGTLDWSSLGFDIGAALSFPIQKIFFVTGSVRVPIIPGRLNYVTSATYEWGVQSSLMGIVQNPPDIGTAKMNLSDAIPAKYMINRPLKVNGQVDFKPMGDFFVLSGGLGLGIRNPFSETEVTWYPEYYFAVKVEALHIVGCTVSTQYTDQMFKHSVDIMLNARVLEIDLGASLASANFVSSFRGAGLGAYIGIAIGF